jgi:hypothetical protein
LIALRQENKCDALNLFKHTIENTVSQQKTEIFSCITCKNLLTFPVNGEQNMTDEQSTTPPTIAPDAHKKNRSQESVWVSKETKDALRKIAIAEQRTVSAVVNRCVDLYLRTPRENRD